MDEERTRHEALRTKHVQTFLYSPGTIKCAVVVPAFMIHTPPGFGLSGNPIDAVVAPGTAIVMCVRAVD